MSRTTAAVLIAVLALFLAANRKAYLGYFQADDLDNLSWASQLSPLDYFRGLVSPQFVRGTFRPLGHLYYYAIERLAGLRYRPYLAALHLFHLANIVLVWWLAQKLGISPRPAALAALFFAYQPAAFDAYWKPMYIFDVLCASFSLLCVLAYASRRWLLGFLLFWLAYKSKEIAILLPAVLAVYEWTLGERKWKRLLPFFLVSLCFGIQALISNPRTHDEYTLQFVPATLWRGVAYYSSAMFLAPYLGLLTLALPLLVRDRRVWLGVAMLWLLLIPVLPLPGRLHSVYLYLPLAGAGLALAAIADRYGRTGFVVAAAGILIWLPFFHLRLRPNRDAALFAAYENRAYVSAVAEFAASHPRVTSFVYDGAPQEMHPWGIAGALGYLYHRKDLRVVSAETPEAPRVLAASCGTLVWDPATRSLEALYHDPDQPDATYVSLSRQTPIWQLEEGWYARSGYFRWIAPYARARLQRSAGARQFEAVLNIGPQFIQQVGTTRLQVILNGQLAGAREFHEPGVQSVRWDLPPAAPGPVTVEFRVAPEFRPPGESRILGIPVMSFGFVS